MAVNEDSRNRAAEIVKRLFDKPDDSRAIIIITMDQQTGGLFRMGMAGDSDALMAMLSKVNERVAKHVMPKAVYEDLMKEINADTECPVHGPGGCPEHADDERITHQGNGVVN